MYLVLGVIVIILLVKSASYPSKFWVMLVPISITTAGLSINGLTIYDEILTVSILLGTLIAIVNRKTGYKKRSYEQIETWIRYVFNILIIYLILQSLRGVIIFGEVKKIRWVVYFITIGLTSYILLNRDVEKSNYKSFAYSIVRWSFIYFLAYIITGVIFEFILNISKFEMQPGHTMQFLWGTTAYVMFPAIVALPASLILFNEKDKKVKRIARLFIAEIIFISFYYESRIIQLSVIIFFAALLITKRTNKRIIWAYIFLILVAVLLFSKGAVVHDNVARKIDDLFKSVTFLMGSNNNPENADLDRIILVKVAFKCINEDVLHFLIGYGYRTSGFIIGSPYYFMIKQYLPRKQYFTGDLDNFGAEAFTNIVVETGLIGILLFEILFVLQVVFFLRQRNNKYKYYCIAALISMNIWIFVINMLDIILFFWVLMPKGILYHMTHNSQKFNQVKHKIG